MPQARLFLTVSANRLQWCTENLLNAKPYRDELARTARKLFPEQADAGLAFWRPDTAPNQPNNHNAIACALLLNRPDPIQQARNALYQYILLLSEQDYRTHPLNPVALLRTILTPELLEPTFHHNAPAEKKRQAVENNERITIIDNTYGNFQPVATQQTPQLDLIQSAAGSDLENVQTYLAACIAQPTKVPPLCFSPIGNAANAAADFLHQPSVKLLETLYLCLPADLWTNLCWSICQHGPQFNNALNQAVQPIHSNPPNELATVMQNDVKPLFSALAQGNLSEVDKLRHSYIPNSPNANIPKEPEDKNRIINQLKEKIEARPLTEIVAQRQGSELPQQRPTIVYDDNTEPNDSNINWAYLFERRDFIWIGLSTLLIVITALLAFYVGTFYGGGGGNKQPDTLSLVKNGFTSTFTLPNQENVANETDPNQLGKMLGQMAKTQAEQINNLSAAVKNQPNEENRLVEEFRHAFRGAYQTNKYDYNKALNAATIAELGQQFGELSKKKDTEITVLNKNIQTLSNNLTQKTAKLAEIDDTVKQREDTITQLTSNLTQKTAEVAKLQSTIQGHENTIAAQKSELAQKTAEVTKLQGTIQEHENTIATQKSNLTQKTDKVAELESIVKQKTDKVAELKGTVEQREDTIAQLTNDLNQKTAKVAELKGTIQWHENTITQLTSYLNQEKAEVAELKDTVKQHDGTITQLTSDLTQKTAKVAQLEGTVKLKTAKVAELESTVEQHKGTISQLTSYLSQEKAEVAELKDTVKQRDGTITQLTSDLSQKTVEVTKLQSTIQWHENTISTQKSELAQKTAKVTKLQGTIQGHENTIATQKSELAQKTAEVAGLKGTVKQHEDTITQLTSDLTQKNTEVAELENTRNQHKDTITQLTSDLSQKTAEVTKLQGTIQWHENTITQLTSDLTPAKVAELIEVAELENTLNQHEDTIDQLTSDLSQETIEVAELENTLNQHENTIDQLTSDLSQEKDEVAELKGTVEQHEDTISQLTSDLTQETIEVAELENTLNQHEDTIAQLTSDLSQEKAEVAGLEDTIQRHENTIFSLDKVISDVSQALETDDYDSAKNKIACMVQPKPCSDSYCYGYQDGYQDGYGYNDKAIQESCSHFYCKGYNDGYDDSKKFLVQN
jgi:chromosome segregation ATPase